MADDTPTPPGGSTPTEAEVSPTGTPYLSPEIAKYALPVVAVAAAITMAPDMGLVLPAVLLTYSKLVVLIGTVLGIVSPGARKKP